MGRYHGYEVCTEGDAFLVAFHTPEDACAFCVAVQQVRGAPPAGRGCSRHGWIELAHARHGCSRLDWI